MTAAACCATWASTSTVYERSPAELEQRGAGIGFLPASVSLPRRARPARARHASAVRDRPHPLPRPRRLERRTTRRTRYRFSSWNTVYRQLLQVLRPVRATSLAHEVTGSSVEPLTVRFTNGEPSSTVDLAGVRRRRRLRRARAGCCPTSRRHTPDTSRGGAWCPRRSSTRRRAWRSTMPSPTTSTRTATSSCTRSRVATGRSRPASGW